VEKAVSSGTRADSRLQKKEGEAERAKGTGRERGRRSQVSPEKTWFRYQGERSQAEEHVLISENIQVGPHLRESGAKEGALTQ